ncbi:MAG: DUF4055 domain-containing protein [Verrucomicrobia bacterium]|nr:DUF4055 domain-containing protein [Verrucomicrobiota bacterium]
MDSTHPSYDENLPAWLRARDVLSGEDAVKAGGVRYLPRLDSQTDEEYSAYKERASFFNASARTADGFVGLIFRREPTFKIPDQAAGVGRALSAFVDDANMLGTSLSAYAKDVVREVISVGRAGTLVDWEDEAEQRAYAVLYSAEQIINWQMRRVHGRNVLSLVVLREVRQESADPFVSDQTEQLRVLRLVEDTEKSPEKKQGWFYQVEIWALQDAGARKKRGKQEWVKIETRVPRRLGKPLPLIPFVFHGPRNCQECVSKLPLADIISINLDHYRLNADYKHGLHFTALPTAWVSGFDKASELRIGSSTAWVAETPGATAGFLEFTGQGLTTFERAMDRDERLMAVLGTRMLEGQKRAVEAAEAIELRQSGESSVLAAVSLSLSDSMTQLLRWVYWWNSTEDFPDAIGNEFVLAQLNTDFSPRGMPSSEILAIVAAWQAGAISHESMSELFRRGEVLPPGRTNEEEAALVRNSTVKPKQETEN